MWNRIQGQHTITKTTKTKHAARIDITFWKIFKQFFEVYNVNQLFIALEMHQRKRHKRTLQYVHVKISSL